MSDAIFPSDEPVRRRILVTDDEAAARRGTCRALGRQKYSFVEAENGLECLELLDSLDFDLILLDLRMPGLDGLATLERLRERESSPPVVVITADANLRTAVDAVRAGAADFLAKPYDIEELRWVVERTLKGDALSRENAQLRHQVRRLAGPGRLLGSSSAMDALREEIAKVGPTLAGVLIRGETGTGKELVARELHRLSGRGKGPFVAVNCAAVPEGLLESELFGHRKGAFTGADRDRTGRFREAHGGTLFLDEVGDMPAAAQAKLLRVLQERVVEPVGGGKPVEVDVRVLAATHRDLEALVEESAFRQDLYYRLRVVELHLPPLRQRQGDVLELAVAFLQSLGLSSPTLDPRASQALASHPWPGNIRELRNAMERSAIFCQAEHVALDDLPADLRSGATPASPAFPGGDGASSGGGPSPAATPEWPSGTEFQAAKAAMVESFERSFIVRLLERHCGNLSAAARDAGIHRQNLQKKLRQLGLDPGAFRPTE